MRPYLETYEITPSMRLRALLYFFGWQGGTIHQVAAETGLDQLQILNAPLDPTPRLGHSVDGFSAIRTCDREWRRDTLAPKHRGNWQFFASAIRGFWITGPIDGLDDRWPDHPIKTGLMRCTN